MKASFRIEAPRYGGELLNVSSSEALGQGVELRSSTASQRAFGAHEPQPAWPSSGDEELHTVAASFGTPGVPRYGSSLLEPRSTWPLGHDLELRSSTASNRAFGAHEPQPAWPGFGAQELHGIKSSFLSSGAPTRSRFGILRSSTRRPGAQELHCVRAGFWSS